MNFNSWAMALPRFVLRCRTEFSGQLARSFSVKRSGVPAAHTAVFPLPVPFDGCFQESGRSEVPSAAALQKLRRSKAEDRWYWAVAALRLP